MQPWIDFLPQEYRQRRRRLRQRWQQAALVGGAVALAALSVLWQQWRWHRLQDQLQAAQNHLALCQQQGQVLQEYRRQLGQAQAQAALCCFLEHPWSRTRMLAFLLHSLPEQARLKQVRFFYQQQEALAENARGGPGQRPRPGTPENQKKQPSPHPAVEDLEQLRQEQQQRRLLVLVEGTAGGYDQVQQLLARLRSVPALQRLQLLEVESEPPGRLAFRIQGLFHPAFPGPEKKSPAPKPQTRQSLLAPPRR